MVKGTILVSNPTGLHTRPAKNVVAKAKQFESKIIIKYGEKEADAKSLLKIMKLGITQNNEIELQCDGSDEEKALSTMTEFILNLEG
ncbi:MAG: HPr family phosphocarrier protein [Spirochaetales bacterium]|uniref:Phosphocarrier protein HPr n=1 Tax=Candidatus Thalassospirochaeta sargassi TaxID=3119039 RepID=A0AAJ1MM41_9SPIO|nr:HPr family phosphocarrier protein [Spirochaetales bacterium]